MGAPGPSSSERLDRLNPVERELLVLLGRGHTAKSIATLKRLSVAAVNERFRAARRKTGFGSSREIARLLMAQENRHDLIDLASDPVTASDLLRRDASPSRDASLLGRWRYPMLATGLLAVALLSQQTSTPPASTSTGEDQVVVAGIPDRAALHMEALGAPDPAWSPAAETALSRYYEAAVGVPNGMGSLGVSCSATLCEVAGATRAGLSSEQITDLTERLQPLEPVPGLERVIQSFGTTADQPTAFVFVTYWRRRD